MQNVFLLGSFDISVVIASMRCYYYMIRDSATSNISLHVNPLRLLSTVMHENANKMSVSILLHL